MSKTSRCVKKKQTNFYLIFNPWFIVPFLRPVHHPALLAVQDLAVNTGLQWVLRLGMEPPGPEPETASP